MVLKFLIRSLYALFIEERSVLTLAGQLTIFLLVAPQGLTKKCREGISELKKTG